jgi:hypothetical protein
MFKTDNIITPYCCNSHLNVIFEFMFILTNGLFSLELPYNRWYTQLSSLRALLLLPAGLFSLLFTWGSRSPFGKCEDNALLGCDTCYFSVETLKMEAVGFCTTLVSIWQSTVRQIPEEFISNTHAYVLPKLACTFLQGRVTKLCERMGVWRRSILFSHEEFCEGNNKVGSESRGRDFWNNNYRKLN